MNYRYHEQLHYRRGFFNTMFQAWGILAAVAAGLQLMQLLALVDTSHVLLFRVMLGVLLVVAVLAAALAHYHYRRATTELAAGGCTDHSVEHWNRRDGLNPFTRTDNTRPDA